VRAVLTNNAGNEVISTATTHALVVDNASSTNFGGSNGTNGSGATDANSGSGVTVSVTTIHYLRAVMCYGDVVDAGYNLAQLLPHLVELGVGQAIAEGREQLSLGRRHHHTGRATQLSRYIGGPQMGHCIGIRQQLQGGEDGGGVAGLAVMPDRQYAPVCQRGMVLVGVVTRDLLLGNELLQGGERHHGHA
jgi:hypothetical protein